MSLRPVQVRLEWTTPVPVERAWQVLSDSDRFNRVLGTGTRMSREELPDGRTRHIGTMQRLGMTIRWEEHPRHFEAPHWYRLERELSAGPVRLLQVHVALEEVEAGTRVAFTATLHPRVALLRPVVWLEAHGRLAPAVERTIGRALAELAGEAGAYEPPTPPLDPGQERRLAQRAEAMTSPIAEPLAEYLRTAPPYRQARMSPLFLGRVWDREELQVVDGFLEAARAGLVELQWELLCPNCRGPEGRVDVLPTGSVEVHCGSCDIRYDGAFLDAVAISFATVPEIRPTDRSVACQMSPARTPHVLTRRAVRPGRMLGWSLELAEGTYRLDTDALDGAATLEVRSTASADQVTFDLTSRGLLPRRARVRPGPVRVFVRSRLGEERRVHIKDPRWPDHVLTASRFLSRPGAAELLPAGAIAPGLDIRGRTAAVVAVEILRGGDGEEVRHILERSEPLRVLTGPLRAVAAWADPADALEALRLLAHRVGLSAALTVGPILEVGDGALGGVAVDRAREAARGVGAGRTVVLVEALEDVRCRTRIEPLQPIPLDDERLWIFRSIARGRLVTEEPQDGDLVGDWRIEHRIADGGFGAVYAARHPDTGQVAAVKMLRPEHAADPVYVERFYEEARVTATLQHPSAVEVLDWGFDAAGRLYLAMERLLGSPLSDEIQDHDALEPQRAVAVLAAALEVLDEAHSAGIVHCDVKPANVMVCTSSGSRRPGLREGERITLVDFGVASPLRDRFGEEVGGTPGFMSPEQADRRPLDHRSDLYSVGATLVYAVLRAPPPVDLERLPAELASVVRRALAEDPDERWEDAASMRRALLESVGLVDAP